MYDITSKSSDWWFARLARDSKPDGAALGKQGWVPSSFLEKFTKSLSPDEEAAYWMGMYTIHMIPQHQLKPQLEYLLMASYGVL